MYGSYEVSTTDGHNVHRIHSKKSALQRKKKQQDRALLKQLAIACGVIGAAGIVYWTCASATNHASTIPPVQSGEIIVPFMRPIDQPPIPTSPVPVVLTVASISTPPPAQPLPHEPVPRVPTRKLSFTPEVQNIMEEYKISCDIHVHRASPENPIPRTPYDIGNAQRNLGKTAGMELQEAYAKGLVSALPEAITEIVKGYTPKLDEKRYNTIFQLIQAVSLETIQPYELIEPHGSGEFTGFFWLLDKYEKLKRGNETQRTLVSDKISEVVQAYPDIVNTPYTAKSDGGTMCHYISIISKINPEQVQSFSFIDHTLFDIFIQYGKKPSWNMPTQDARNCLMHLLSYHHLTFNPKDPEKAKTLFRDMAAQCGINTQDNEGLTALHHALKCSVSPEIIEFLISELHADPRITTTERKRKGLREYSRYKNTKTVLPQNALQYAREHTFIFPGQEEHQDLVINILTQAIERLDQQEKEAKKPTEPFKGLDQES